MDVKLNDFIEGNMVRVPTSPSFFRVAKSTNNNTYYQLAITYQLDPETSSEVVKESQVDPFPDVFS